MTCGGAVNARGWPTLRSCHSPAELSEKAIGESCGHESLGGPLSESLYGRVWAIARGNPLTDAEAASPLALRLYNLRHAAVSTWLNGGLPAPQVASWAGHSVAVLLRVYAKCIAGQEATARHRIGLALGLPE